MRSRCVFFVLISVLPLLCQSIPAGLWQTFSSPVAGFSVLMPGEPQESIADPEFSAFYAQDVKVYSAHVGLDAGLFSVVERIYPQPLDSDVPGNLERFQSLASHDAHARVLKRQDVTVQGVTGRRLWLASEFMGKSLTQQQVLLIKANRLFQLIALSASAPLDDKQIDRFFSSFTITGEAKDWKRSRSQPNEVVERNEPEPAQNAGFVTGFECPTYPSDAKARRLGGLVKIQVTTDGAKITNLKVTGHPILAKAAEGNLRTWKLAANAPRTFVVEYIYVNEGEYEPDPVYNCRAKLQLPEKVEVSTNW